jgi:spoIIIJ-associated protein
MLEELEEESLDQEGEQEECLEEGGIKESEAQEAVVDDYKEETETGLTDEELDQIADAALETIRNILKYFEAEDAPIDEFEGDEGELLFDIGSDNLAVLIGRHGKTLDALQFLVSSIVSKKSGLRHPIVVDIEGYKHRRRQKLESLAKSSAARAIRQKSDVRLRPMSPYERRLIHIVLRNDARVTTFSEGKEPNRQIVIRVL